MGSEREQQFCLRWHNYQNCLLATLPQLLDGDDLTDVTLCAGGRNIKAHKVVLSACSQYFKDLFKEMVPMQHPVIVLPGTYFTDLCALVTFMYSGEVNIFEHQLAGLLSVAETLQIRGLAEFTGTGMTGISDMGKKDINSGKFKRTKTNNPISSNVPVEEITVSPPIPPRPRNRITADDSWMETDQSIAEDLSNRTTSGESTETNISADPNGNNMVPSTGSPSLTLDLASTATDLTQGVAETKTRNSSGNAKMYSTCCICGKQLSNQYNLRVHMETHQNAHYACSACNHVSRSRDALRKHVSYRHPQQPAVPSPSPAIPPRHP